jgi:hypothetical protein
VQHVTETSFSAFSFGFFLKAQEPSQMSMVKESITIFPKLKRGTVEDGTQVCWLTAVGIL